MKVRELMQRNVITVCFDMPLQKLSRVLDQYRISGAPVTTADGELMGLVSKTDLVRHLAENPQDLYHEDVRVWEIMRPDVHTIDADADVEAAALEMAKQKIHRVVIFEGEKVVGILTTLDIVRMVAERYVQKFE